jgi:hypothetical protein
MEVSVGDIRFVDMQFLRTGEIDPVRERGVAGGKTAIMTRDEARRTGIRAAFNPKLPTLLEPRCEAGQRPWRRRQRPTSGSSWFDRYRIQRQ